MPDRFQEFSYHSYPSPPGSAESPSTSNDSGSVVDVNVGFTNWTRDHGLDALYDDADVMSEWTDEDLEYLSSIPLEDLVLPDASNVPETFFQDFLQAQNGNVVTSPEDGSYPTGAAHYAPASGHSTNAYTVAIPVPESTPPPAPVSGSEPASYPTAVRSPSALAIDLGHIGEPTASILASDPTARRKATPSSPCARRLELFRM